MNTNIKTVIENYNSWIKPETEIEELKQLSKSFNERTKKAIKGCSFAAMNVNEYGIEDMWGDFNSKKAAKEAISMWRIVAAKLNGTFSSRLEGNKIRVVLTF